MSPICVVRDYVDPWGKVRPTQPIFIDSSQLATYQAAGYRLPLGAPIAPATEANYPGFDMSPTDISPWEFDWGQQWLGLGETLVSSIWIQAGLTIVSQSFTTTTTSVTVTGPAIGRTYLVTNRITSSLGREDDQSFTVTGIQR